MAGVQFLHGNVIPYWHVLHPAQRQSTFRSSRFRTYAREIDVKRTRAIAELARVARPQLPVQLNFFQLPFFFSSRDGQLTLQRHRPPLSLYTSRISPVRL